METVTEGEGAKGGMEGLDAQARRPLPGLAKNLPMSRQERVGGGASLVDLVWPGLARLAGAFPRWAGEA